jgi:hypothetical protein
VDYTIDVPYCLQFSNLFQEKKNWAALPLLINTYFSLDINPPSRIPRSKIERKKIEKVCGQTSFISDMKLYTISLQNPNKKTHLKTLVVPH